MTRNSNSLPSWALSLLERIVPYRNRDVVIGDFAEIFYYVAREDGWLPAIRWYLWQFMRSLPSFVMNGFSVGGSMVGSYVKVAVRNLSKRKFYAALNIGGLAIGMAVCLLILQYVVFETSYDSFHENADNLYRVNLGSYQEGELISQDPYTFHAIAPLILETVPEIERVVRIHPSYGTATVRILDGTDAPVSFRESGVGFVDAEFATMFTYSPSIGDAAVTLDSKGTAVLSKSAVRRFFGDSDPIGRIIDVRGWVDGEYTVGAVIEDMPTNSHIRFDIMLPIEDLIENENGQYAETDGWSWTNFVTYVQLGSGADISAVEKKIVTVVDASRAESRGGRTSSASIELQPIQRIHLYSDTEDMFSANAAYKTVLFLSIIGIFILLIAWVNYVNLTTARAVERAREVGIRKASGAKRSQVFSQFLVESLFLNLVALVLAVAAAHYALPLLNELVGVSIPTTIWQSKLVWIGLIGIFGVGAIVASLYPSLVLSAFQPISVLKGKYGSGVAGTRLRKGLVVFQFALSISLISGMYIVYEQVQYLRGVDLGFNLDQTLVVQRPSIIDNDEEYRSNREIFTSRALELASISNAAMSTSIPGGGYNLGTIFRRESVPDTEVLPVNVVWVNDTFIDTYKFELIAGRNFQADNETDRELGVLVNEKTVDVLGYDSNEAAIGGRIVFGRSSPAVILGVLRDFSWMSAKSELSPVVLSYSEGGAWYSFRIGTQNLGSTIDDLEGFYSELFPGNTFDYFFADEHFDELFLVEERLQTLVSLFAAFAILVAALGLVGLSALTASQRIKEISIRKVLGASDFGIARLLTGHFALLVIIGVALAVPAVYFVADGWLNEFAVRISLSAEQFLIPGLIVLMMALLSSGFHVFRVAHANPIEGIRSD